MKLSSENYAVVTQFFQNSFCNIQKELESLKYKQDDARMAYNLDAINGQYLYAKNSFGELKLFIQSDEVERPYVKLIATYTDVARLLYDDKESLLSAEYVDNKLQNSNKQICYLLADYFINHKLYKILKKEGFYE